MPHIQVLDQITIDKIAAGEVIERPASVVKELVENAIDAHSTAITTEIKDGGISFIRITDNGCGIEKEDVKNAFLRHSTSKIRSVEDLTGISSLGFRGEALSSISAVAQMELITKTSGYDYGIRYRIDGGREKEMEETGAPDGTTFLVHQLFYNTPARRKFLKTPMTEASHISELLTRLALSHPEISFQFINNGQTKLRTSGNGRLKDAVYSIYGREIANNLLEANFEKPGIQVSGYLGKPIISRGNRNFENYFVNGRYVKSSVISKAIEDAYKDFSMQHKYPFVVLHFTIDGEKIDVNVHPTKMELRFSNQQEIYNFVYEAVDRGLHATELIPEATLPDPVIPVRKAANPQPAPSLLMPKSDRPSDPPQRKATSRQIVQPEEKAVSAPENKDLDYFMAKMRERVNSYHQQEQKEPETVTSEGVPDRGGKSLAEANQVREEISYGKETPETKEAVSEPFLRKPTIPEKPEKPEKPEQLTLFDDQLLKKEEENDYRIIGQVFETYWLVEFRENLYIIDQHAAHERVLYEKTLKGMKTREFTSQYLSPPVILSLSMQEIQVLEMYMEQFTRIGFEIEAFGGDEYAIRAVPDNLFGIAKKELFLEMLDTMTDELHTNMTPELIDEKIASMSCKAAVKGNSKLSAQEIETLIGELLKLENPYHCPHGRPTVIAMSKREMEKKFKRIV